MSDNIPDEIQLEIMKRLPVKSLIRFRSVSKTWKSVIGSSDFIIKHCHHTHSHSQHLLVRYGNDLTMHDDPVGIYYKYVSVIDDGTSTFPEYVPILVKAVTYPRVIGSSHGLMCLHDSKRGELRGFVLVWNVSIRKAVAVFLPRIRDPEYTALGFGVCGETNDPKIVRVVFVDRYDLKDGIRPEVHVFTLSTGAWRNSYGNLPRESIDFYRSSGVVINGVYYWLAIDRITMDGDDNGDAKHVIISFDMTSEEFGEVTIPPGLIRVEIFKLGESLAVVGQHECERFNLDYDVWKMGDGVPKSFTKLFTLTKEEYDTIIGFRKNGELIINRKHNLVVYEPNTKRISSLGIEVRSYSYAVYDYMETLLLLDKPNFMVYNDS